MYVYTDESFLNDIKVIEIRRTGSIQLRSYRSRMFFEYIWNYNY